MQIVIRSGIGPITVVDSNLGLGGLLMVLGHALLVGEHPLVLVR